MICKTPKVPNLGSKMSNIGFREALTGLLGASGAAGIQVSGHHWCVLVSRLATAPTAEQSHIFIYIYTDIPTLLRV